jgi:hypothetical protein
MTACKVTVQRKRSNASVRVLLKLHILLLDVRVDAHVMTVSALYLAELVKSNHPKIALRTKRTTNSIASARSSLTSTTVYLQYV